MTDQLVEAILGGPCSTVADRRTHDRHPLVSGDWVVRTAVRYCDACGHLGPGAHACPGRSTPLPHSAVAFAAAARAAGWAVRADAVVRGDTTWSHGVAAAPRGDPYREVRLSYHDGRFYDALIRRPYQGWTSGHSIKAATAFLTEGASP